MIRESDRRRIRAAVRQSEAGRLDAPLRGSRPEPTGRPISLRITGSTSAGTRRWYYAAEQVVPNATAGTWTAAPTGLVLASDGSTPYLVNLAEQHPSATVWGNQIDTDLDAPDGGGLTLRPIAAGTVVTARPIGSDSGTVLWAFERANGVTVECPE